MEGHREALNAIKERQNVIEQHLLFDLKEVKHIPFSFPDLWCPGRVITLISKTRKEFMLQVNRTIGTQIKADRCSPLTVS